MLLAVLVISLAACTFEEKPLEASDTAASSGMSDTTTPDTTAAQESTATSSASIISNENKTYIAFPDMSREEEREINKWLKETKMGRSTFYCDPESDMYYFSWSNYRNGDSFNATGGIYKMDGKTHAVTKLSDDSAISISLHDDWLYFINSAEFNMLFKMWLDGTERQRVTDMSMWDYKFVDDRIVVCESFLPKFGILSGKYDVFSRKTVRLSQIDLEGNGYEIVSEIQLLPLCYINPYIYARESDWNRSMDDIWRFDKNDFSEPLLVSREQDNSDAGRMLFFLDNDKKVFTKIKKNKSNFDLYEETNSGSEREVCDIAKRMDFLGLINGEIYCSAVCANEQQDAEPEKKQLFKVCDFDSVFPLNYTAYPSDTLFEIAGDYILARNSDGLTLISADGTYEELIIRPNPPVNHDTVGEMQEKSQSYSA